MEKTQILMNKPAYLGLSILELSKILIVCYYHRIYEFQNESTLYSFACISRHSLLEAGAISEN